MIFIKNISGEVKQLHLHEFQVDEILDISDAQSSWANNDDVLVAITNQSFEVHSEDGAIEGISNQINHLKSSIPAKVSVVEDCTKIKFLDGKDIVLPTARKRGTYMYWTGADDDHLDPTKTGGFENVQLMCGHHKIGDPDTPLYFDFNIIVNETHIRQGIAQWMGARNDTVTLEIVPQVSEWELGENTNFNLYNGAIIIPAAGDGLINVTNPKLIQCITNEFGTKCMGFWNADFNSTTKQFENITPAPMGDGQFNMVAVEFVLNRFGNQIILLGDGSRLIASDDMTQIGHGMRFKFTPKTRGEDHEWWWCVNLNFYRKVTC